MTKAQSGVDLKRLRELYGSDATARSVLDHLASRERNWATTTVDRIYANVSSDGAGVSRADIVRVFRELEACRCGEFKAGRRKWPSRFEWSVEMVGVGQAAAQETDKVEQISEDDRRDVSDTNVLKHSFRLRRDLTVVFELPSDLSQTEALRLADFIKTVPFSSN
jgi:hypothetical protein